MALMDKKIHTIASGLENNDLTYDKDRAKSIIKTIYRAKSIIKTIYAS